MWKYALHRIVMAVPIALGVTVVCFALVFLAPGNPLQSMIPADASQEDIDRLKQMYGFDKPVPVQYLLWLQRAVTGDLGFSLQTGRPVLLEVTNALSNTFVIASGAVLVAFTLAFVLGTVAAYNVGRPADRIATGAAVLGVSIPNYWLGIVLIIIFAVKLGVLPATGMGSKGSTHFNIFDWVQLKYAILPVCTMALVPLGVIMRTTRSAVAEVLNQDFVQMLRAKGLGPVTILRHAVRNALPQMLTVMGLQLGYLVGGSILIETVFTWPGTGFLLNKAILTRDVPMIQGAILVLALNFVAINLTVDLVQTAIDPRIKRT
jgi:peptide/nickel transport system permease protein